LVSRPGKQTMTTNAASKAGFDILFIACSFPPVAGTASRGNVETVRQLRAAGFRVAVVGAEFTIYPRDESLQGVPDEASVHRFPADDKDTFPRKVARNLGFPPDRVSFRWVRHIERIAGELLRRHRIPLVYSVFAGLPNSAIPGSATGSTINTCGRPPWPPGRHGCGAGWKTN
jgi:hypothetical protein